MALVEAAAGGRASSDAGAGGPRGPAVFVTGGAGGSLASHRFFRRQPRHQRSCCWGPRRARQVLSLGVPLSVPPLEPASSCRRRPPVEGLAVGAPGAPPAAAVASGAAAVVDGGGLVLARRRSHPLWLLHPRHHCVRSGSAVRHARGSAVLGGGSVFSWVSPVPRFVWTGAPAPPEAVSALASAPPSVSASVCCGRGDCAGAGGGRAPASGGGPATGVQSSRAAML